MKNIKENSNLLLILNTGIARLILIVIFVIGIMTHQFGLMIFSFLLITLNLLSYFWCRFSKKKVLINLAADKVKLFPGKNLELILKINNNKIIPISFNWAYVFNQKAFKIIKDENHDIKESYLLWFQEAEIILKLKALKRGVYEIRLDSLNVGDFFGFYNTAVKNDEKAEILVYPHILPVKDCFINKKELFDIWEGKNYINDPVNIVGLREYHYSKPAKYINWKASAKTQTLLEKVTEPTINARLFFVIDENSFSSESNIDENDFEKMISCAASLAFGFNKNKYPMGLITNGMVDNENIKILEPLINKSRLSNILEVLAKLDHSKKNIDILEILNNKKILSRGISVIYFLYSSKNLSVYKNFFNRKKIPCSFVVNIINKEDTEFKNLYKIDDIILAKCRGEL